MSYAKQAVTRLTLDMGLPDVQKSVSVTVGDTNRRLEVTLIDRGSPFVLPTTWTAVLAGVLPSGEELYGSCVVDDGRIVFDFVATPAVSSEEGVFAVAFDIFDEGGESVASPKLWMHVTPGARRLESPDAVDALTALREFVREINKVNSELSTHTEQIGELAEDFEEGIQMLDGFDREQGSVKKYVDDAASRSGIYVGSGEMPENCVLQIILDEPDEPNVPDEPDVPDEPEEPNEPDVPEGATQYNVEYKYYDTDQNMTSTSIVGKVTAGQPLNKTIYGKIGHTTERITVQMGAETATVARGEIKNNGIITCFLDADGSEGWVIIAAVTSDVTISIVTAKIDG